MTLLSLKKHSMTKAIISVFSLSILSLSTLMFSSVASANTCSKSDIDYYLQRGFNNAQVVQLCSGTPSQSAQTYQAPTQAQTQQVQQSNQIREDQSYLSAALDTDGVTMTQQNLTLLPRECIEYGPQNNIDLIETICVNTRLTLNYDGLTVGHASKGIFLVKDATVKVKGNLKREFIDINNLRRQDREAILETLKANPNEVILKIRRGIDPGAVASRLKRYAR